jgi:hypothetical protein
MGSYIQILIFVMMGMLLLWFGYSLFSHLRGQVSVGGQRRQKKQVAESIPGAPRTCPVCSVRLERGERVKSSAYPSMGGNDRLMNITGCPYCLEGTRVRSCPVCGIVIKQSEVLIARLFEKPGRSHVHVLGCSRCRGPRSQRPKN